MWELENYDDINSGYNSFFLFEIKQKINNQGVSYLVGSKLIGVFYDNEKYLYFKDEKKVYAVPDEAIGIYKGIRDGELSKEIYDWIIEEIQLGRVKSFFI